MSRFKVVLQGPEKFAVIDLEKPQKRHPKDTWVPNGMLVEIFPTLIQAIQESKKLNGPKRKNKKQKSYQKRSFRNNKTMEKGKSPYKSRPS